MHTVCYRSLFQPKSFTCIDIDSSPGIVQNDQKYRQLLNCDQETTKYIGQISLLMRKLMKLWGEGVEGGLILTRAYERVGKSALSSGDDRGFTRSKQQRRAAGWQLHR
jgi:hypothetical protein